MELVWTRDYQVSVETERTNKLTKFGECLHELLKGNPDYINDNIVINIEDGIYISVLEFSKTKVYLQAKDNSLNFKIEVPEKFAIDLLINLGVLFTSSKWPSLADRVVNLYGAKTGSLEVQFNIKAGNNITVITYDNKVLIDRKENQK